MYGCPASHSAFAQWFSRAEFLKKDEPSVQTTRDPCQLLADARHVKPVFDVFIEAVAGAGRVSRSARARRASGLPGVLWETPTLLLGGFPRRWTP